MIQSLAAQAILNPSLDRPSVSGLDTQRHADTPSGSDNSQIVAAKSATAARSGSDSVQISQDAYAVAKLVARDREVRSHEAAHAAVGAQYAGSPSLTYRKGPDGVSYATGGEVSIDTSAVSGDPQATLQKAEIIRAAALAPTQPSAQDMRVASKATVMAAKARSELAGQASEELMSPAGTAESKAIDSDIGVGGSQESTQGNRPKSDQGSLLRSIA